ncbi:MAG: hypothetical protein CMM87_00150 [Rickettsiales bacterium]|nr:hypothetical protein [Rickettsiales bacterium]|tara:strand:- start:11183 stop:12529 length:1347 start_codon:yes stop_codon:yes gene_type:complete
MKKNFFIIFILSNIFVCKGTFLDLTPDDSDRLALVHVRAEPFEKELIPGNMSYMPDKRMGDLSLPQFRLTVHFCLNAMVPNLPRDESWDSIRIYAVIIPLTRELLEQVYCYQLNDLAFYGPFKLPKDSIFVYPKGKDPGPVGETRYYDQGKISLRETINIILKENNKHILDHKFQSPEDTSGYALLKGKKVNPGSLFSVYHLPQTAPKSHCESNLDIFEVISGLSFLQIFCVRSVMSIEKIEAIYCAEFVLNYLREEYFKTNLSFCLENFLKRELEGAPDETRDLFEKRKNSYEIYRQVWELEKKMVLEEKKSFFISDQFSQILNEAFYAPYGSLETKLRLISKPFDLSKTVESLNMQLWYSDPVINGSEEGSVLWFSWPLNVFFGGLMKDDESLRPLDCDAILYKNNKLFSLLERHLRSYNPELFEEIVLKVAEKFSLPTSKAPPCV